MGSIANLVPSGLFALLAGIGVIVVKIFLIVDRYFKRVKLTAVHRPATKNSKSTKIRIGNPRRGHIRITSWELVILKPLIFWTKLLDRHTPPESGVLLDLPAFADGDIVVGEDGAGFLRQHKAGPGVANIRLRIDRWRKASDVAIKM